MIMGRSGWRVRIGRQPWVQPMNSGGHLPGNGVTLFRLSDALAQPGNKFGIGENVEGFEQCSQMGVAESSDDGNAILSDDNGFVSQFAREVGELLLSLGDRELFGHGLRDESG